MDSTKVLFESPRYFKVWQYTVSHCRLLLRSTKGDFVNTRIDVHFGGVSAMLLRPYYDGLIIRYPSELELAYVVEAGGEIPDDAVVHIIDGEYPSFVVSGQFQWHEDDGGYKDPSWFGHMVGTP